MAGPKRPQDKIELKDMKANFEDALQKPLDKGGFGLSDEQVNKSVAVKRNGKESVMKPGAVVIAAITSCTNTSNPTVMLGAGLVAKKAVERGLHHESVRQDQPAPGSKVVTDYLSRRVGSATTSSG